VIHVTASGRRIQNRRDSTSAHTAESALEPTGARQKVSPYATVPISPDSGDRNDCTGVVLVLVSDDAPWIQDRPWGHGELVRR
jgi:hypothetical protein